MDTLYALISLLAVNALAFVVTRALRPRGLVEAVLTYAVALSLAILFTGYATSATVHFADLGWWAGASVVLCILVAVPLLLHPVTRAECLRKPAIPREIERRITATSARRFDTALLLTLTIVTVVIALANFVLLVSLEPATPDAFEYHLARMAYYLQHGSMAAYGASYWAQVVYPKGATVLVTFAYLTGGHQIGLTQLPQFLAFGICLLVIYGISRHLGAPRRGALFAALVIGLLPIFITEAPTAQNDLLLTAFTGLTIYFLLAYRSSKALTHLALAAAALALVATIKATVLLVLPALGLMALWAMVSAHWNDSARALRHVLLALLFLLIAGLVIVLPSGYAENARLYGDPFGPKSVRSDYTPERLSKGEIIRNTALNTLRYGAEFLRPDALYPLPGADALAHRWAGALRIAFNTVGLNLEAPGGSRPTRPFDFYRLPIAGESTSSWGILGLLLVLPAAFLALFKRRSPLALRLLVLSALLTIVVSAWLLLYDPYHGRFLTATALMAAPALAFLPLGGEKGTRNLFITLHERKLNHLNPVPHEKHEKVPGTFFSPRPIAVICCRIYLIAAVTLGCFIALIAAFFRVGSPFITYRDHGIVFPAPFALDRAAQCVREIPSGWFITYESIVPEDAVVAVDVQTPIPEYLLFGAHLQRRLIPIRPFWGTRTMAPPEAEYVICDAASPYNQKGTLMLTEVDYHYHPLILRRLK